MKKVTMFVLTILMMFVLSAPAHALDRKLVAWFEGAGYQPYTEMEQSLIGTGLADDGTLWELVFDNDCDEDNNYTCWSPICSLSDLTSHMGEMSWIPFSTVPLPEGRTIYAFYPMSLIAIQGKAILDDGTLWNLVNLDSTCNCNDSSTCTPYDVLTSSNFVWYPAAPALPPI